jgi:hypothetical protein
MSKKIEYVSEKLVRSQYCNFRDNQLAIIETGVSEKYIIYFSKAQLHTITAAVYGKLAATLYLQCARYRDAPSYRDQLLMIRDLRQLLERKKPKPQHIHTTKYSHCYDGLCLLLSERVHYVETGILGEGFFNKLRLNKDSFPVENTEKYLEYTEEITRAVIEAMTNMVLEQIFTFFPSEGPAFYRSVFLEASSAAVIEDDGAKNTNHTSTRPRVTFSV